MRLSIWPNPSQDWPVILDEVRHCEDAGWDGAYIPDHFMPSFGDDTAPQSEALALMAALAASTSRVRIGSLVFGNTYRHPAVLLKTISTIDHISGGRALLGIGAGWQENEHRAYGIDLPPVKERLDRFEEAVQVIKGLITHEHFTFEGEHYRITEAPMNPKRADLPLMVGGGGEKRTMRIAAQHADEWNVWSTPETLRRKLDIMRRHCDEVGRDFDDLTVSTQALLFMSEDEAFLENMRNARMPQATMVGTPGQCADTLAEYADLGVDEFILPDFTLPPPGPARTDLIDRFAEVAAPFRN